MARSTRARDRIACYSSYKHKAAQTFITVFVCATVGLFVPHALFDDIGAQRLAVTSTVTFGLLGLFKGAYVLIHGLAEDDDHDAIGMWGYAAMAFILLGCGFVFGPHMLDGVPPVWNQVHVLLVLLAFAIVAVRFVDHAYCCYKAMPKRAAKKAGAAASATAA